MKEACKLKITLLIFLFSGMAVSAQVINRVKIIQTFYDDFKSILDKGDTVKLVEFNNCLRNAKDYGCESEFTLIQAIKKMTIPYYTKNA